MLSLVHVCFGINLSILTQSSLSPCGLAARSQQRFFTGVCHFYGCNRVSEREGPVDDCLILSSQKKRGALIDSTAVLAMEAINHSHLHPSSSQHWGLKWLKTQVYRHTQSAATHLLQFGRHWVALLPKFTRFSPPVEALDGSIWPHKVDLVLQQPKPQLIRFDCNQANRTNYQTMVIFTVAVLIYSQTDPRSHLPSGMIWCAVGLFSFSRSD